LTITTRLDMVLSDNPLETPATTATTSTNNSRVNGEEDSSPSLSLSAASSSQQKEQQQDNSTSSGAGVSSLRQKYKRKRGIPETERELRRLKKQREDEYQQILLKTGPNKSPSIWSFESLFPQPQIDETAVQQDLFAIRNQDSKTSLKRAQAAKKEQQQKQQPQSSNYYNFYNNNNNNNSVVGGSGSLQSPPLATTTSSSASSSKTDSPPSPGSSTSSTSSSSSSSQTSGSMGRKMKSSFFGGPSMMRIWREPRQRALLSKQEYDNKQRNQQMAAGEMMFDADAAVVVVVVATNATASSTTTTTTTSTAIQEEYQAKTSVMADILKRADDKNMARVREAEEAQKAQAATAASSSSSSPLTSLSSKVAKVDKYMTRMVENRMFGYRQTTSNGEYQYDTSLMGDGAIQFRQGIRLGNPLKVNADRLTYLARKELQHGRVEEAQELYETAITIDPRDGRSYLGLAKCAERRRDFKLARDCLQAGINKSVSVGMDASQTPDRGANPYLLQALGCLEEKMGHLSNAESLYIAAVKSRPCHAAAWVALAGLRTKKLGQSAHAGRVCYQTATRELEKAGLPPSSHVCTAWAALEDKMAGDTRRARELFQRAIKIDPKCSAAYLQLGVMEARCENWDEAQKWFDQVLKFDGRNSRVLQAYALMETKRPDGSSRKAIDLFERALKASSRDAGVLQAYGLYVAELGDVNAARELLRRGTDVNKRHAPVWQAWGVLETRHGSAEMARSVFQQGIWACAQLAGSQSGGYHCARLWQAWGVLEAREGDFPAARRCFSRALDADNRNVPAITAWSQMEERMGNVMDARSIFERALRNFAPGSDDKNTLWRNYELMEQRLGNVTQAQKVYQRSMREVMAISDEVMVAEEGMELDAKRQRKESLVAAQQQLPAMDSVLKKSTEVEVVRWNMVDDSGSSLGREVWLNDNAIEGKVPGFRLNNKKRNPKST
jgi:tetratricopeptide (TPR) repeat protein